MNAKIFLGRVVGTVEERRNDYGNPDAFFRKLARRWSLTLGQGVTPEQVVLCLIDLKQERLCHDPSHRDSMVDIAGYAACLAELAR
jgi:hypothetical protein